MPDFKKSEMIFSSYLIFDRKNLIIFQTLDVRFTITQEIYVIHDPEKSESHVRFITTNNLMSMRKQLMHDLKGNKICVLSMLRTLCAILCIF